MVAVQSTMLPLGTVAPGFELADGEGQLHSLESIAADSNALVVAFICNHCPYVKLIADRLAEVGNGLLDRGVAVVAINSNDADSHPDDSPEAMVRESAQRGYLFPYLFDADQSVAHAYRAACTPDFFLFDAEQKLAYRGRFDAARPGNGEPVTGEDLLAAVEDVLEGRGVTEGQTPSMGCNIKWRPGNEPDWFS
jgi:peroxiredoxin